MSEGLSRLRRRLARVERALANVPKQENRGKCNCPVFTMANTMQPEKFEAEMNLKCPEHGFRNLGRIVLIEHIGRRGDPRVKEGQLHNLVSEYRARERAARISTMNRQFEYDTEEY